VANKFIKFLLPLLLVLSLAGCVPVVTITSPQDGDVFAVGEEITFSGTATDFTSGALPDDALIWTSDRDGEIGQGGTFTRSDLSEGVHIITLSATNDAAQTGSATIQITVGTVTPGTTTTIGQTTSTSGPPQSCEGLTGRQLECCQQQLPPDQCNPGGNTSTTTVSSGGNGSTCFLRRSRYSASTTVCPMIQATTFTTTMS
jgi:hypothetical protein